MSTGGRTIPSTVRAVAGCAVADELQPRELDDKGARKGIIGLQVHSGGPTEVRFRELNLELNPKPEMKTVR